MSGQFKVDEFRSLISAEDRAELDSLVEAGRTSTALKRWLDDLRDEYSDRGVELPYTPQRSVDRWYNARRQVAEEARKLKALGAELQGTDPEDLSRIATLSSLKILETASQLITADRMKEMPASSIVASSLSAARALQAIATETRKQEDLQSTRTLERAGAYRAIEIMIQLSKDTRYSNEIREYAKAALAQFETET